MLPTSLTNTSNVLGAFPRGNPIRLSSFCLLENGFPQPLLISLHHQLQIHALPQHAFIIISPSPAFASSEILAVVLFFVKAIASSYKDSLGIRTRCSSEHLSQARAYGSGKACVQPTRPLAGCPRPRCGYTTRLLPVLPLPPPHHHHDHDHHHHDSSS